MGDIFGRKALVGDFVVLWCALCIVYCGGEELRGFGGSFGRFMLVGGYRVLLYVRYGCLSL